MENDLIQCRKLEIVDELGRPRIIMHASSKASVILLSGPEGTSLQISSDGENPVEIHLFRGPVPQVSAGVFRNGDAGIVVRDDSGKPVALVGFDKGLGAGVVKRVDDQS